MRLAKERSADLVAKGEAVWCDECNGEGGTIHGVCIQCHGAGTLPVNPTATIKCACPVTDRLQCVQIRYPNRSGAEPDEGCECICHDTGE
jgi:DnaJ-class molecular chaperone